MTKTVLLNNVTHKNLKVITGHSADYGDNVNCVLTFPTEFADVQREYPIFFQKNPDTGKFQSVILLGISPGENLFLQGNTWNASYIPAIVARGPFLIGFQDQSVQGGDEKAPVVHIDMDNPRVNESEGQAVFLDHGGNSRYLEKINSILQGIYQGMSVSDQMFTAFTALDLIEPVALEIELNNGEKHRLHGNYTISKDKLARLSGDNLAKLNAAGLLEGAFLVSASLTNMKKLINMKNAKLQA